MATEECALVECMVALPHRFEAKGLCCERVSVPVTDPCIYDEQGIYGDANARLTSTRRLRR